MKTLSPATQKAAIIRHYLQLAGIPQEQVANLDIKIGKNTTKCNFTRKRKDPLTEYVKAGLIRAEHEAAARRLERMHIETLPPSGMSMEFIGGGFGDPLTERRMDAMDAFNRAVLAISEPTRLWVLRVAVNGDRLPRMDFMTPSKRTKVRAELVAGLNDLAKYFGYL